MGGMNNPEQNRKLLKDEDNLKRKNLLESTSAYNFGKRIGDGTHQVKMAMSDMHKEYKLMKSHNWKQLDDYYHCKANYNATKQGNIGEITSLVAGNYKEGVDYFRNRAKGISYKEARDDYWNDVSVNEEGRRRARENNGLSAQDACADYREKNNKLPKEYW